MERLLGRLPGVMKAKADQHTQTVRLTLDTEQTPLEEVHERFSLAGFHPW